MDFLDEINDILRLAGLEQLDEAAPSAKRLWPMFQNVLQIAPSPKVRDQIEHKTNQEINWARRVLEREDRIIWYLRYVQLGLILEIKNDIEDGLLAHQQHDGQQMDVSDTYSHPEVAPLWNLVNKKAAQMAAKAGTTPDNIIRAAGQTLRGDALKQEMVHYMSMPIHGIQNHTFGYELPQQLINHFKEISKEWEEDQDRVVDAPGPEDGGVILIDFGDGVAWWDLETAYCPQEAACMGHCGNQPRESSDDTILSLRKEFPMNGEMKYSCMLTFILNENGMLTEMKGRGNDKPAERYHKYIVPLLRHEKIEGIVGGGYMPENNFGLKDLEDDELREQLIDEKPGLAGPTYFIERAWEAGDYDEAAREVQNLMDDHGLEVPGGRAEFDLTHAEKGMHAVDVILDQWENYEALVKEHGDGAPESLFKLLEEIDGLDIKPDNVDESIDEEFLIHVFESLPIGLVISVARGVGVTPSKDQHKMARGIAKVLDKEREGNRFFDYVADAAHKAIDASAVNGQVEKLREEIMDRLEAYASEGLHVRPHVIGVGPVENDNIVFGPWAMTIGMQDLMNALEAGMAGGGEDVWEDDDYHVYAEWSSYDGISVDEYSGSSDHRGKYGNFPDMELGTYNEPDKLAKEFDEDKIMLAMDQLINNTAAILNQTLRTGITPASDHSKQQKLSLEAKRREAAFREELAEIKRLAGLSLV